MELREAKATSKLLHALAGDPALDPVTAAAVLQTLSFTAGAGLQVSQIPTPTGLRTAVATASTHPTISPTNHDTTGGLA